MKIWMSSALFLLLSSFVLAVAAMEPLEIYENPVNDVKLIEGDSYVSNIRHGVIIASETEQICKPLTMHCYSRLILTVEVDVGCFGRLGNTGYEININNTTGKTEVYAFATKILPDVAETMTCSSSSEIATFEIKLDDTPFLEDVELKWLSR